MYHPTPTIPKLPGALLTDEARKKDYSLQDVARHTGCELVELLNIAAHRAPITLSIALKLETCLDPSAEEWVKMQGVMDVYDAKNINRLVAQGSLSVRHQI